MRKASGTRSGRPRIGVIRVEGRRAAAVVHPAPFLSSGAGTSPQLDPSTLNPHSLSAVMPSYGLSLNST
jgi:hypothetical protein